MARAKPAAADAPQMLTRAKRVKRAKDTIAKVIPDVLRSSPRARHGVHSPRLFKSPDLSTVTGPPTNSALRIRLRNTDCLTAARQLAQSSRRASQGDVPLSNEPYAVKPHTPNVCVLNMATPNCIGGSFLDGGLSQEEFLCMRTTLLPSLWPDHYPLPEVGGLLSPDVLVMRDAGTDAEELPKREQFFIDVISAGMIRYPGSVNGRRLVEQDEDRMPCSCGVSYCDLHRALVLQKMRAVLAIAKNEGAEKLVLGAWGCGAFQNPPREVAKLWRQALLGLRTPTHDSQSGLKEVVFAITDRTCLREFERCFSDILLRSADARTHGPTRSETEFRSPASSSERLTDLFVKIQDTEIQLAQARNARTRTRLREQLNNLNSELARVDSAEADDVLLDEDDFVIDGYAVGSDQEESGYYHFDEDDIATTGSNSPASVYEFQVRPINAKTPEPGPEAHFDVESSPSTREFAHGSHQRRQFDDSNGWFTGSINSLSAMLNKQRGGMLGSPVLGPQDMASDVSSPTNDSSNAKMTAFLDGLPSLD